MTSKNVRVHPVRTLSVTSDSTPGRVLTSLTRRGTIPSMRVISGIEDASGPHLIGPGLYVRVPADVVCEPGEYGSPYHVKLKIDFSGGRLGCTELTVKAPDGETITGTALRVVPVASIVREAARLLVMGGKQEPDYMRYYPYTPDFDVSAGPTEAALRGVAASYSVAYVLGEPPAKAVERDLGLPTSTAGRWIKLARDKGFLPIPADKGRRA